MTAMELLTVEIDDIQELNSIKMNEITNIDGNTSTSTEKIISVTKTSNRVYEPKIYKEAISNLIHSRQ